MDVPLQDHRPAHKAPTHTEEQIGICIRQTTKNIKGITIYSNRDVRGESRVFVEYMPVGVVVHRHNKRYSNTFPASSFYTFDPSDQAGSLQK
jgi:hypothetical protein